MLFFLRFDADEDLGLGRMVLWLANTSDDIRLRVCEFFWPREWLGFINSTCRSTRTFLCRRDTQIAILSLLPEDAFTLTSPLWQLIRLGFAVGKQLFLEAAFAAMAQGRDSDGCGAVGRRTRLLGRCFTLAAQRGIVGLVALALECGVDVEQRINGQSALDGAAQSGHVSVVDMLVIARAEPGQTAATRWTPLMRAALGGHKDVCHLLLEVRAPVDQFAERTTALDVALANGHEHIAAALKESSAKRYLEMRPAERHAAPPRRAIAPVVAHSLGRSREGNTRLRPGPVSLGGGLPRGIRVGSSQLRLSVRMDADSNSDGSSDTNPF